MLLGLGATQQWEKLSLQGSATWGPWGPKSLMARTDLWLDVQVCRTHTAFTGLESKSPFHRNGGNSSSINVETPLVGHLCGTKVCGWGWQGPCSTGSSVHISIWSSVLADQCHMQGNHSAAPGPRETGHGLIHVTWAVLLWSQVPGLHLGKTAQELCAPGPPSPHLGSCWGAGPFSMLPLPPPPFSICQGICPF